MLHIRNMVGVARQSICRTLLGVTESGLPQMGCQLNHDWLSIVDTRGMVDPSVHRPFLGSF